MFKKASRVVILFGLIMSMSFTVSFSPISASSQNTSFYKQNEDFQIQAASREVSHSIVKYGSGRLKIIIISVTRTDIQGGFHWRT